MLIDSRPEADDLALLASRVAVEIDNILLGREGNLSMLPRLADRLSTLNEEGPPGAQRASLVDPFVMIVKHAMVATGSSITSFPELRKSAHEVAEALRTPSDPQLGLQRVRAFCLALSRAAAAAESAVDEVEPPHPFSV